MSHSTDHRRTTTQPALALSGVSATLAGKRVLDNITLELQSASITGVLGRNGAGKTTLFSIMAGHRRASSGNVHNPHATASRSQDQPERFCFIRDNQRYPDSFTLRNVLQTAPKFFPRWDAVVAQTVAETFDLPAKTQVSKFSRGQLTALAMTISLASRAEITLLDEPALGLDAIGRLTLNELIINEQLQHERTFVLATHLIDEMESLLEHVFIINDGKISAQGNPDTLTAEHTQLSGHVRELDAALARIVSTAGSSAILYQRTVGQLGHAVVRTAALEHAGIGASNATEHSILINRPTLQEVVTTYGAKTRKSDRSAHTAQPA